jgi:high-affinity nickel permease
MALDRSVELLVRHHHLNYGISLQRVMRNFAGVGSSVSAFFLFIVGLANSIILHRVLRRRRQVRSITRLGYDSLLNGD